MTDLIDRLERSFEALIHALEEQNAEKIIEAAAAIRPMVSEIEALAAHQGEAQMDVSLANLSELVDASQYRVKFLTKIYR